MVSFASANTLSHSTVTYSIVKTTNYNFNGHVYIVENCNHKISNENVLTPAGKLGLLLTTIHGIYFGQFVVFHFNLSFSMLYVSKPKLSSITLVEAHSYFHRPA